MAYEKQLSICNLSFKIMDEKLDKIIESNENICEKINKLNETNVAQSAINREVFKAIADLNSKANKQEDVISSLSLFIWFGKNWAILTGSFIALGSLVVAYLTIKK